MFYNGWIKQRKLPAPSSTHVCVREYVHTCVEWPRHWRNVTNGKDHLKCAEWAKPFFFRFVSFFMAWVSTKNHRRGRGQHRIYYIFVMRSHSRMYYTHTHTHVRRIMYIYIYICETMCIPYILLMYIVNNYAYCDMCVYAC
jgi:hypothetical protein